MQTVCMNFLKIGKPCFFTTKGVRYKLSKAYVLLSDRTCLVGRQVKWGFDTVLDIKGLSTKVYIERNRSTRNDNYGI